MEDFLRLQHKKQSGAAGDDRAEICVHTRHLATLTPAAVCAFQIGNLEKFTL